MSAKIRFALVVCALFCVSVMARHYQLAELPGAVQQAFKKNYPLSKVEKISRESEGDVPQYEFSLMQAGRPVTVTFDEQGNRGESEEIVKQDSLSKETQSRIQAAAGEAKVRRVEKHVVYGKVQNGAFVPLDKPYTFFNLKCVRDGWKKYIRLLEDPAQLGDIPEPVRQALKKDYSGAQVKEIGAEMEHGVSLHEFELSQNDRSFSVEYDAQGNRGESEELVTLESLAAEVQARVRSAMGETQTLKIEKHIVYGIAKDGSFAPLEHSYVFYDLKGERDGWKKSVSLPEDPNQKLTVPLDKEEEDGEDDDD